MDPTTPWRRAAALASLLAASALVAACNRDVGEPAAPSTPTPDVRPSTSPSTGGSMTTPGATTPPMPPASAASQ